MTYKESFSMYPCIDTGTRENDVENDEELGSPE